MGQATLTPPAQKSSTTSKSFTAKAFGATSANSPLAATTVRRRTPGPTDVKIDILYCGVCHSDLHQTRGEW
ncbi:MAG TPA: hypothetical protein VMT67_13395 [Terriglobales bacterium]|nr:hypothetical protein [Terriglobales bacterium]